MASKRTKSAPTPSPGAPAINGAVALRGPTGESAKATTERGTNATRAKAVVTAPRAPEKTAASPRAPSRAVHRATDDAIARPIIVAEASKPKASVVTEVAPAPTGKASIGAESRAAMNAAPSNDGDGIAPSPAAAPFVPVNECAATNGAGCTPRSARAIAPEERFRMIAETAYAFAERQGFANDSVATWLIAEREIDARLANSTT